MSKSSEDAGIVEKLLQIHMKSHNMDDPLSDGICKYLSYLSDEDIVFLMELPLVPEVMGITGHVGYCRECGPRIASLVIEKK